MSAFYRDRLFGRLYRALSLDPRVRPVMRLSHASGAAWSIADQTLTLGAPAAATIALAPPATVRTVADAALAAGWSVTDLDPDALTLGALAFLDQEPTAAGPILAHDSLLWALASSLAVPLADAAEAAATIAAQMDTSQATGDWADYHATYFGVPRLAGEPDAAFTARIIAEVLKPKSNNLAMAAIIRAVTGQAARVIDVTAYGPSVPNYDGTITHNGAYTHNASAKAIKGLFDVEVPWDLLGSDNDPDLYIQTITAQVHRVRAAGTHLRAVVLSDSAITDSAVMPTDSGFGGALNPIATLAEAAIARPGDTGAQTATFALASTASLPGEIFATTFDFAFLNPSSAPSDTLAPIAGTPPDPPEAAALPDDSGLVVGGPGGFDADMADTPDAAPTDGSAQTAALAFAAETVPVPSNTLAALSANPVLAEAVPVPTDAAAQTATLGNTPDPVSVPTDDGSITANYVHTLNGAWTLNGNVLLSSTSPLNLPL